MKCTVYEGRASQPARQVAVYLSSFHIRSFVLWPSHHKQQHDNIIISSTRAVVVGGGHNKIYKVRGSSGNTSCARKINVQLRTFSREINGKQASK